MIIKVFPRYKAIEQANVDYANDKIIISISTPGDKFPIFPENNSILDILYLSFYDIENKKEIPSATDDQVFNEHIAEEITMFLDYWINETDSLTTNDNFEIWVHCDAGVSRSAGIGAALSKYFNNNDDEFFANDGKYFPNNLCYRLMLSELYEKIGYRFK